MVVRITEMMQLVSLEKVIRPHTPLVFFPFNPYTVKPLLWETSIQGTQDMFGNGKIFT